jgi:hypothetical protein
MIYNFLNGISPSYLSSQYYPEKIHVHIFLHVVDDHVHLSVKKYWEQVELEKIEQHILKQPLGETHDDQRYLAPWRLPIKDKHERSIKTSLQ